MAIANLKLWKNGEILNARDYVYERNLIVSEVNRLSALVTGDGESVDLSVGGLNASSITLGPKTISSFNDVGISSYLSNTEPNEYEVNEGDLWFQTEQ